MSTPAPLTAALTSYEKSYDLAYTKALEKMDGKVWYEPSEAERKAVVADKRKGRDLAYAPTGTSLQAGKLMSEADFQALMAKRAAAVIRQSLPTRSWSPPLHRQPLHRR